MKDKNFGHRKRELTTSPMKSSADLAVVSQGSWQPPFECEHSDWSVVCEPRVVAPWLSEHGTLYLLHRPGAELCSESAASSAARDHADP